MTDDPKILQEAVERLHDCRAVYREATPVRETFEGQIVWEGVVHIFDLQDHPSASACYAWSSPVHGSDRRRFYAVLQSPPIASAFDAVRASVVAENRERR